MNKEEDPKTTPEEPCQIEKPHRPLFARVAGFPLRCLKSLYDWVLHWAETPYGSPALFFLAVAESSFFPVPPDPLLAALSLGRPKRSFHYALYCSIGSVIGGIIGYVIGMFLYDTVGVPILKTLSLTDAADGVFKLYNEKDAWVVSIAGFTPIPYKVITITAG